MFFGVTVDFFAVPVEKGSGRIGCFSELRWTILFFQSYSGNRTHHPCHSADAARGEVSRANLAPDGLQMLAVRMTDAGNVEMTLAKVC